ncbi:MAG: UDP-glucose/GDP-mannose dehydrogenase family protein, partial [Betaproteobacteria bacterium]|nr:UDP-glucose/GDP-mannose dehydrogenase family protein [Betaproteobacteria bacterium]
GLDDLVVRNRKQGRLHFTTDTAQAIGHGDVIFIAVGTPPQEDGSADLSYALKAASDIGRCMRGDKVVVNKSTVPVGTAERVHDAIAHELGQRGIDLEGGKTVEGHSRLRCAVVSNPEFLKEGAAVEDFMRPDRIVLGVSSDASGQWALGLMRNLYAPFNRHHERTLVMSQRAAELTKYAANAMLATRISFMNELANLSERLNVDIESVRQGMGSDPRIGYSFLYAGTGYGGSCFPKDVKALHRTGIEQGMAMQILSAVEHVNQRQKHRILDKVLGYFGEDLTGLCFGVWGLAFKPETDDMREAPSRTVIGGLLRAGARVQVHDPVAMESAQLALQEDLIDMPQLWNQLSFHEDPMDVAEDAQALLIMTEWKAYRSPNFQQLRNRLAQAIIFDGRNLFDPVRMAQESFIYEGIGRVTNASKPIASDSPSLTVG